MSVLDQAAVVSVFGSARPGTGTPEYDQARRLGAGLARRGWAVATGGYGGTMEAVSRGAAEERALVIGVTADHIEAYRPTPPNRWVGQEIRYPTGRERLDHLVRRNRAMVVLPGGLGTLAEWALAWNLLQTGELEGRPLLALGSMWGGLWASLEASPWVTEKEAALCRVLPDVEAVLAALGDADG